jgi:hypothetical protein
VRERDLVLVPVAEAIWGYEQHHGFGRAWRVAAWQRTPRSRRWGAGGAGQIEGHGGDEGHSEEEQEPGTNEC